MKFAVSAAVLSIALVGAVGCANKTNKAATEPTPAVTDLTPAPAPAPAPVVVQPAPQPPAEEAPLKEAPAAKGSISGHKYTVQKGDTLYNIAVRKYGKGTAANIAKIEKANPGVKASSLKVGQKITLP